MMVRLILKASKSSIKDIEKLGKIIFKSDISNLIGLETNKKNIEVLKKMKGIHGIKVSDKGTVLKTVHQ